MFGTDLGWGVDDLLNQPCEVVEKYLEGRNKFLIIRIQIVSVKTIFAFYGCDSQGQPINVIIVGIIFGAHTPIPLIGTKNNM